MADQNSFLQNKRFAVVFRACSRVIGVVLTYYFDFYQRSHVARSLCCILKIAAYLFNIQNIGQGQIKNLGD